MASRCLFLHAALDIFNAREGKCTNGSATRHLTTATKLLENKDIFREKQNSSLPVICDDFWVSGFVIGKKFGEENSKYTYKVKPKAWRVEPGKKLQIVFLVMKPRKIIFRQIYFGCSVSVKAHGDDVETSIKCSELWYKERRKVKLF